MREGQLPLEKFPHFFAQAISPKILLSLVLIILGKKNIFYYLDFNFVHIIVKPFHQSDEKFVSILLLIAPEAVLVFSNCTFKVRRWNWTYIVLPQFTNLKCKLQFKSFVQGVEYVETLIFTHHLSKFNCNVSPGRRSFVYKRWVSVFSEESCEQFDVG